MTSLHDHVRLLLPAIALGTADENELDLALAHVGECAVCEEQLIEFYETAGMLNAVHGPVEAPAHLKARVMSQIDHAIEVEALTAGRPVVQPAIPRSSSPFRRWFTLAPIGAAACAAMVALVLVMGDSNPAVSPPQPAPSQQLQVQLAPTADRSLASVRMVQQDQTVLVSGLPPAGKDRVWQLWQIDGAGSTHSLGVAKSSQSVRVPKSAALIALTREPAGGSRTPSMQPLLTVRV